VTCVQADQPRLVSPDDFPLAVPDHRFDQRNEMFKRRTWDDNIHRQVDRLYSEVHYQERYGFRKLDYALRNAAWSIESGFAHGTQSGNRGMYSWDYVTEKVRNHAEAGGPVRHSPEANARIVKKAARFFGADLVGTCYAHPNLIYSHELDLISGEHHPVELLEGCRHAIVMAVEMDYKSLHYCSDAITGAVTGLGYSRQAVLAHFVAAFIRGLGYQAIPCGNDTALSIPLAIAAGLGELGRMGLLITEKYGPRVRLCKVFTDLPLSHDAFRPFGVAEFCRTCRQCAVHCSAQAISFGEPTMEGPSTANHSGVRKWYIDPGKCYLFWAQNWMDCSRCVAVCPFNKPADRLHDAVRFIIGRFPALNRLWLWANDLAGYGRQVAGRGPGFWETL
jgi:epoxyqueuosine reductase